MSILTDDNLNCNCDHNLHIGYDWAAHTELVGTEAAHSVVVVVVDDDETAEEEEEVAGNAEEEAGDQDR